MVSVLVHTTLIRDQNGLGFSIAGGEGSPAFKDNSDVRHITLLILIKLHNFLHLTIFAFFTQFVGDIHFENN